MTTALMKQPLSCLMRATACYPLHFALPLVLHVRHTHWEARMSFHSCTLRRKERTRSQRSGPSPLPWFKTTSATYRSPPKGSTRRAKASPRNEP